MANRTSAFRLIPGRTVDGVGSLAQRLVYTNEELLQSLENSLGFREAEIAQRDSLPSRIMALVLGRDAGRSIEIDGMRLHQLLALVDDPPAERLNLSGFYSVNLAYFRILLRRAAKRAGVAPEGVVGV